MRLAKKNGRVEVRLYSDDPSPGMAETNSFDLIMTMPPEIQNYSELPDRPWVSSSMSMEKQDTPYGIFLNNQREIFTAERQGSVLWTVALHARCYFRHVCSLPQR